MAGSGRFGEVEVSVGCWAAGSGWFGEVGFGGKGLGTPTAAPPSHCQRRHPPTNCPAPKPLTTHVLPYPASTQAQSKTQVEGDVRTEESGTRKASLGVARGQAFAANGLECWTEDCADPIAEVGAGQRVGVGGVG